MYQVYLCVGTITNIDSTVKKIPLKRTMLRKWSIDIELNSEGEMWCFLVEIIDKLSMEIWIGLIYLKTQWMLWFSFWQWIKTDSYKGNLSEIKIKCQ